MFLRKRWKILFLAILIAAGCATSHNYLDLDKPCYEGNGGIVIDQDLEIRVVTYNIRHAKRINEAIASLQQNIALHNIDILLLQEMDVPGVEKIARVLGMNYVYYPELVSHQTQRDMGNAVLSPWPIEESRKISLPHKSFISNNIRAAVMARIFINGHSLRVYSVHLGSAFALSNKNRRDQAKVILEDAKESSDPVIIAGDFNSKNIGTLFEAEGFAWPTKTVGPTFSFIKGFSYDHVFTRGLRLRDGSSRGVVTEAKGISDHRPVWVVLLPDNAVSGLVSPIKD